MDFLKWADDPFKEPAVWTEAKKKILLDDHRLVHAAYRNLQSGKKLFHRKGPLNGRPITKEWVERLHKWIVRHILKLGYKHNIVDDLDRTLPLDLKDRSEHKTILLRDVLYNENKQLMEALTTISGQSLIPKEVDGKPVDVKWALYLVRPHGLLIWKKQKDMLVKMVRLKKHINEPLLLVSGINAFGIIKLGEPEEINQDKFKKLFPRHKITQDEADKWGFSKAEKLYTYKVNLVKLYKEPVKIQKPQGLQNFTEINKIRIQKAEDQKGVIVMAVKTKDVTQYISELAKITPDALKKLDNSDVVRLHLLLHKVFDDAERAKKNTPSNEDLASWHMYVIAEMKSRGIKHLWKSKLDDMKAPAPAPKKHVEMVKKALLNVKDMILVNDYVNIVGSAINGGKDEDPKDIDILVRDDFRDQNLELKLSRVLREGGIEKPLHFVWSSRGPHSTYVKLADMILRIDKSFTTVEVKDDRGKNVKKCAVCDTEFLGECPECIQKETETPAADTIELGIKPFSNFSPPKPAMKGITEAFSIKDIEEWVDKYIAEGIDVEEKLNGFRTRIDKSGDRMRIYFADVARDKSDQMSDVSETIKKIPDDFVFDCEIGIERGGKKLSRVSLMTFLADKIQLQEGDKIVCTGFDLPYWKEDLSGKPLHERRILLEAFFHKYLSGSKNFALTSYNVVKSKPELISKVKKLSMLSGSEGVVMKAVNSTYHSGGMTEWSKLKKAVELKAKIIAKQVNSNRTFNYYGAITAGSSEFSNVKEISGEKLIVLGKTMSTKIAAQVGDIITCSIEELIVTKDNKLSWTISRVMDVDRERTEPYAAAQSVDIANRGGVLQEFGKSLDTIEEPVATEPEITEAVSPKEVNEDETNRAGAAVDFWKNNWKDMYNKSTSKFVLHSHWRGLNEEESKKSNEELLNTNNSVHQDLRVEAKPGGNLWGFTLFTGTAAELKALSGDAVTNIGEKHIRGTHKLLVPRGWLTIRSGYLSAPNEAGATTKSWAKFFVAKKGTLKNGTWNRSFQEIFIGGTRYIMTKAEIAGEDRFWLMSKPADQKWYSETHKLDTVVNELKGRGHEWLWWAEKGKEPILINIKTYKPKES
jgi:hypothetical protein